jgi:hypothetical protein
MDVIFIRNTQYAILSGTKYDRQVAKGTSKGGVVGSPEQTRGDCNCVYMGRSACE